jgi:hypothetical protein
LLSLLLSLAAGPALAQQGSNAVGINTHVPTRDMLDAVADAGLSWIRVDADWPTGEPRQGSYQWGHLDAAIDEATARGLKVFLTIAYTPEWASAGNRSAEHPEARNDVPRPGLYERYVAEVVHRYQDRVTHYGMWNEPNLEGFFEGSVQEYVDRILEPGAAAVKQSCPTCLVLGPDLAGIKQWQDFLEEVLDQAGDSLDILTHHSYRGFTETEDGWLWVCDDLAHVLESGTDPLLCFYTRGVKEVMADAGYSTDDLEVWMTEVGYRTEPVGDGEEEERQAIYYERTLEEQLERSFWTNTFFYEIMDCECGPAGTDWGCMPQGSCDIDGFGILRRTAAPDATWADNFRQKPAFTRLKSFVASHDQFQGAPPAACADGIDNDGDELPDLLDPGCTDATDDEEGDDPPRPRIPVPGRMQPPTVDGSFAEWPRGGWTTLDLTHWIGLRADAVPPGAADLLATFALLWTPDDLYLAVAVTDDRHVNAFAAADLWQGDSVQVAFDPGRQGGLDYDADDLELGFGLLTTGPDRYRWAGGGGPGVLAAEVAVVRQQTSTRYEVRLPGSSLPGLLLQPGTVAGFTLLVNEDDEAGREGWLEWTPGIGRAKAPGLFGEIVLGAPEPGEGEGEGEGEEGEGEEGEGEGEEGEGEEGEGEEGEGEGEEGEGEGEGAEGEGEGAEGEGEGAEGEGEGAEGEGEGAEGEGEGSEGEGSAPHEEAATGGCQLGPNPETGRLATALRRSLWLLVARPR